MLTVQFRFRVSAADADVWSKAMSSHMDAVREQCPGFLGGVLVRSQDDPDRWSTMTKWTDRQAFDGRPADTDPDSIGIVVERSEIETDDYYDEVGRWDGFQG